MDNLSNVEIQHISATEITQDSIVVIKVNTGNMPMSKAKEYMESIRLHGVELFSPAHVLVTAQDTNITVFKKSDFDGNS